MFEVSSFGCRVQGSGYRRLCIEVNYVISIPHYGTSCAYESPPVPQSGMVLDLRFFPANSVLLRVPGAGYRRLCIEVNYVISMSLSRWAGQVVSIPMVGTS